VGERERVSKGFFITLEGVEGSGKSTQAHMLASSLEEHGLAVVLLREPGSTVIGDAVRRILLSREHEKMTAETEALLYTSARAQMVAERVRPALEAGKVVVCDRYVDSSLAYQSFGRGLSREMVFEINDWATGGLGPDVTVLLDVSVEEGLARATRTECDRIEAESSDFHERVRGGYLKLAAEQPDRIMVFDALLPAETLRDTIAAAVMKRLRSSRGA